MRKRKQKGGLKGPGVSTIRLGPDTVRFVNMNKPLTIEEMKTIENGDFVCSTIQTAKNCLPASQVYSNFDPPFPAAVVELATYDECVNTLSANTSRLIQEAEDSGCLATRKELVRIGKKFSKALDLLVEVKGDLE